MALPGGRFCYYMVRGSLMVSDLLNKALRAQYTQHGRIVRLDTPLGEDRLIPLYVRGRACLGRDFEFTIDATSTRLELIQAKALIRQSVTLWIRQTDGSEMPIHGYVTAFSRLGADGANTYYQLRFNSFLALLRLGSDRRDWVEAPAQQTVSDVLAKYPQASGNVTWQLRRALRSYSQRMQWESDWNYVHRTFEELGLFPRFDIAPDGKSHRVVIMDDLFSVPELKRRTISFSGSVQDEEFDGLSEWIDSQEIQSAELDTGTFDYKRPDLSKHVTMPAFDLDDVPGLGEQYEYTGSHTWSDRDMGEAQANFIAEEWRSRAQRFYGVGALRCAWPGRYGLLTGHPVHDAQLEQDREMAILSVSWLIQNNMPGLENLMRFRKSVRAEVEQVRTNGAGSVVRHTDGGVGFFHVEIEAQRRRVAFRSPFEHKRPVMQLQTGIVGGPGSEEIHTDAMLRAKVRLTSDRRNDGDQNVSAWIRAAMPDAGHKRGGMFPLRKNDEVLIGFVNGDCDRPVILSRMHGGESMPEWHTHGLTSGLLSREYGGEGYNQLMMDDASGQNRVHLYSTSYSSHLHLGYLIQHSGNTRGAFIGQGFDLKSLGYGAVRAEQGLYVSTQPAATQPMRATAASEQLTRAEAMLATTSQASQTNRAQSQQDGHDALKTFTDATRHPVAGTIKGGRTAGGGTGNANGFAKPIMLLSSPEGIAVSTQGSAHVTANKQANVVAGENINLAAGRALLASVLERISLFAEKLGVKIYAGSGPIDLQAQNDSMSLTASQDVKITAGKRMYLSADEIWIGANGSYIKLTANMIENATSGQIVEKCADWEKAGAASGALRNPLHSSPVSADGGRFTVFSG